MDIKTEIGMYRGIIVFLELVCGTLVCKSDMKPFTKAFLTIVLSEGIKDAGDREIRKVVKRHETETKSQEET